MQGRCVGGDYMRPQTRSLVYHRSKKMSDRRVEVCPFQTFLVCMDSPDGQQVAGREVNVACKFNLGPMCRRVNLQAIAQMFPELGGKCVIERMAAVFFRLSVNMPCLRNKIMDLGLERVRELGRDNTQAIYRRALVLLYETGGGVITGMADETESRYMAHMFCAMLAERTGIPAVLTDFTMKNIVINCQMQYGLDLDLLKSMSTLSARIKYNPQKFPMAVVHSASFFDSTLPASDRKTAALLTDGGCINITGVDTLMGGIKFLREIHPELYRFQTDPTTGALLHMNAPALRYRGGAAQLLAARVSSLLTSPSPSPSPGPIRLPHAPQAPHTSASSMGTDEDEDEEDADAQPNDNSELVLPPAGDEPTPVEDLALFLQIDCMPEGTSWDVLMGAVLGNVTGVTDAA